MVKEVLLNFVRCAIAGGVLEYLSPDKNKKILRAVVSVLLIFSCVSPLAGEDFDFNQFFLLVEDGENSAYEALMHTANLMEKEIYSHIKNTLINSGVGEYEIYIDTSLNEEENAVVLNSVKIEISKEFFHLTEEIVNSLFGEYGEVLEVSVKNE